MREQREKREDNPKSNRAKRFENKTKHLSRWQREHLTITDSDRYYEKLREEEANETNKS